jgi:hypothetical protein
MAGALRLEALAATVDIVAGDASLDCDPRRRIRLTEDTWDENIDTRQAAHCWKHLLVVATRRYSRPRISVCIERERFAYFTRGEIWRR